jgi:hypothetical protein
VPSAPNAFSRKQLNLSNAVFFSPDEFLGLEEGHKERYTPCSASGSTIASQTLTNIQLPLLHGETPVVQAAGRYFSHPNVHYVGVCQPVTQRACTVTPHRWFIPSSSGVHAAAEADAARMEAATYAHPVHWQLLGNPPPPPPYPPLPPHPSTPPLFLRFYSVHSFFTPLMAPRHRHQRPHRLHRAPRSAPHPHSRAVLHNTHRRM